MSQNCNIAFFSKLPILTQLSYEEALLRVDNENWCLINQGTPPAIVLGRTNKIEEHVADPAFPIIRRFSGGGSVVVDENTFFISFILANPHSVMDPRAVMSTTFALLVPAFHQLDFRHIETDYTIGEKKIGGSAISITKNRLLHHISFLFDYEVERMSCLAHPPQEPLYRKKRPHNQFLGKLRDYFPSMGDIQERLLKALQERFLITEKNEDDLIRIAALPHRKATAGELPYSLRRG